MKEAGALAAGAFWPEFLRPPETMEPLARGILTDISGKSYGGPVEILQANRYYQYLIREGKRTRYVPMKSVQITEGYPFPDIVTKTAVGVRLDEPGLMAHVAPMGAGSVRIFGPHEELGNSESVFERAIRAAEAEGLSPLILYAPTGPQSNVREKIEGILANHPTAVIQLGNEPENPVVEFWRGRDLSSFADFVMTAVGAVWEKSWSLGGKTQVVLAGLQDINNTEKFLRIMKQAGLNFANPYLKMGLHSYQGVWDLSAKLPIVRGAYRKLSLPMPKYWLTEVGVTYPGWSKWIALEMVQYGFAAGVERAYVHTLVDGTEGFELMNGDGSVHLPTYFGFAALARRI